MYIVIEGQDATGKSTQVEMLADYLRLSGRLVVTFHEPDGDLPQTHILRDLIKNKDYHLQPMTQVLLFTAARLELWQNLAVPALKQGGFVVAARNWWSTLAYQGYGQGVSRTKILKIVKQIMPAEYVQPAQGLILTLDDDLRLSRQKLRDQNIAASGKSTQDTFESQPDDFQQRVNHAYTKIAKEFGIRTLDASGSPEALHHQIIQLLGLDRLK